MSNQLLNQTEDTVHEVERQIVALHLGNEIYGIDIAHIHTIIVPQAITHVPKAPEFVKGVMNLRGRIIPVLDLRERFGMPPLAPERIKNTRIVIVDVEGLTAGLIVDGVSEVLRLTASAIQAPSQLVASVETECITGIGRIKAHRDQSQLKTGAGQAEVDTSSEDQLIILLDIHKTLTINAKDIDTLTSKAA